MAKTKEVPFNNEPNNLGEIKVTTQVLESIAAQAASEVPGVAVKSEDTQLQIGSFLGMVHQGVETKIIYNEPIMKVEVKLNVYFGYSVPEVALQVQDRVKEQILFMTDIPVDEVDVYVVGIEMEIDSSAYDSTDNLEDE